MNVGTREEWLAARRLLLAAEKEHTRSGDELFASLTRLIAAQAGVEVGFD